MYYVKEFFLFIMCITLLTVIQLVLSSSLSNLKHLVDSYGIISNMISQNISHVIINNKSYEIYQFDYVNSFYSRQYVTLSKFYTSDNCEFAEWTQNELVKLFKLFPFEYTSGIEHGRNNIFFNAYQELDVVFNNITTRTEKIINILLNFNSLYLNSNDTSVDTNILTVLLLFNIKINIINTLLYYYII